MKYFIDTEFLDDGRDIILISIGIVAEDGREYYAQDALVKDCDWTPFPWLAENVIPHLSNDAWKGRIMIRCDVKRFIDAGEGKPEFWAWCGAYDFVALCQLFGTMMEIPASWPHYMRDIQYLLDERGISDDQLPPQEETAHNALADAYHIKRLWQWLHQDQPEEATA